MTEWLLLALLIPAIIVPVVLLFGFAGCEFEHGHLSPSPPVIESAVGKSVSTITLTWKVAQAATTVQFQRTKVGSGQQPDPPFDVMPSATPYDDGGLEPATTYSYQARAVYGYPDNETSAWSAPVEGTTLAAPRASFDATGSGSSGSGNNSVTVTWFHTASGDSRAVVVGLRWRQTSFFQGTPTRTVTYGGVPMTPLGVIGLNNTPLTAANGTYHEFFGALGPPTGPQTVSLTVARANASIDVTGCSVSYVEVSAFGSVTSVAGTEAGTSLSQTVNSSPNEMIVQMFTTATGSITGYNKTLRFDAGANGFVIGDAPGAASVSFTASRAAGVDYAGLALRLTPPMP